MTGEQKELTNWQKGERMLKRLIRELPQCEGRLVIDAGSLRCVYEAGHTDAHFFLEDPEVNRG